jgi:O-antigen/teichoic acid export membrane protein
VAGVTTGLALVLAACAPFLIELLIGSAYASAVTPLRILLPGTVILGVQSVVSMYVASRGRPRAVATAWVIAAIVTVIGNVIAIPRWGASGAAAVSTASYALVLVLHLRPLRAARAGVVTT